MQVIEEEKEQDSNIILRVIKGLVSGVINFISTRLTAVYELIRGVFIGFTRGSDYREGWILTFMRLAGPIAPRLVNHAPQDYVNSTRLASKNLFKYSPELPN